MATGTPQPLWRGVIMLLMLHGRIHATIVYDVITCFVPAKPYKMVLGFLDGPGS